MTTLTYHAGATVFQLAINECVMRVAFNPDGRRFWHLWFYVTRQTDGVPEVFSVPMNPRGPFTADGPGGKTWCLAEVSAGTWQVSPSINVLMTREAHPGVHETIGSLWHETPSIAGVPAGEPWANGAAP